MTSKSGSAICIACGDIDRNTDKRRCLMCKCVWYCNKKCQRDDWVVHRSACHDSLFLLRDYDGNLMANVPEHTALSPVCTRCLKPAAQHCDRCGEHYCSWACYSHHRGVTDGTDLCRPLPTLDTFAALHGADEMKSSVERAPRLRDGTLFMTIPKLPGPIPSVARRLDSKNVQIALSAEGLTFPPSITANFLWIRSSDYNAYMRALNTTQQIALFEMLHSRRSPVHTQYTGEQPWEAHPFMQRPAGLHKCTYGV